MSRRNYEEIDIRERRRGVDRELDFLREDYGRTSAGPLVVRDDRSDSIPSRSRPQERLRDRDVVERDEVIIARGPREPQRPRERDLDREEITYRTQDRPIARAVKREEVAYRPREWEPPAPPPPQIAREREEFVFRRQAREPSYEREHITIREQEREPERPRDRGYQEEEIIIRRDERERERERPREKDYQEEEIVIRRNERERERERPRERDYQEEEIIIRRDERDRDREREKAPRERKYEEEVIIRRDERERAPSRVRNRSYDREEIIIRKDDRDRERQRPRASSFERQEISIRTEERERPRARSRGEIREEDIYIRRGEREKPRARSRDRREEEEIIVRRETKDRDQPRERSWERSHRGGGDEDIIIRHDENEKRHRDEVIIRRKEPEPVPEYVPPPPPDPEPIRAPPIHQEIITHHRHIDHGFQRAPVPTPPRPRSPSPKPRSPSPPPSFAEIEIRHRDSHNGRYHEDDIRIEHRSGSRPRDHEHRSSRPRSLSPPVRPTYSTRNERDIAEEAEYYNKRVSERAYIGEGYSGATKDWAIVDVPPGTSRVQMEGIGGASQEITWQRYNGVRRSRFTAEEDSVVGTHARIAGDEHLMQKTTRDIDTRDRGRRFVAEKEDVMWTEITKDLVIKEAIEEMGYDYEETEFFFYVMVYLRYEDVLNLVEVTDHIKRDRRARIREIEFERTAHPTYERRREPLALGWDEEKIYEREVIYEPGGSRRHR